MDNIFTVLPMSQMFDLEAGGTYTGKITVVNPANATSDFKYKIGVTPYGVGGRDYTADLATMTNRTQIAEWITINETSGSLKPNESHEVEFTINVPQNAPAGGQYAAITVSSDNDESGADDVAVKNIFEMASLVYSTVKGETVHGGEIVENNVPGFVLDTPINVTALITNTGNMHEMATLKLEVTDMVSGTKILPSESNSGTYSELIMPETERMVSRDIDNLPTVGIVRVSQTVYYNGETSVVEQNVIICPIWFMVVVVAAICLIITLIVRTIFKRRRKKAMM